MAERVSAAALSKTSGTPDPLIGRSINERFKITALIARGGMGKVYRAEQAPLGRLCAIKVLNPNYAGEHDPEFHKRFFLEASIASKLTHPNTVTIFDYGRADDDIYYMAMEYLEGQTLHRAIREAGYFPEERACHIARQICRALREAHSLGVIHRDLKPANIFLVQHGDESDFVKVLDFGLVKNVAEGKGEELTQTGLFMGSPKYMAPEQIRGDRVDARTDIYALGVIMYEMIVGKVPFDRPNSVNILMAHVNEEVPPMRQVNPNCQVSPEVEATVLRCMAKDPDHRFRSMDEVLAALKRAGGGALTATVSGLGTGEYRTFGTGSGAYASVIGSSPQVGSDPSAAFRSGSAGVAPVGTGSSASGAQSSASQPAAAFASVTAKAPGRMPLVLAGVGVVGIVAAVAAFAFRGSEAKGPNVAASAAAAVATTTSTQDPGAAQAASAPSLLKLRVTSDPEGASVKDDGVETCNQTPCDISYRGAEADPSKEHKLTVSKAGFRPESRTVKIGEGSVSFKLTRVAPVWSPPPAPPPKAPDNKNEAPAGYKVDVPY